MKLLTPLGMLLTVAMMAINGAYAFLIGSIEKSWLLQAAGVLSMAAMYGVAMLRPWSQYLVYALTVGFLAKLSLSLYEGVSSGFFGFQFDDPATIAISLAPSVAMALLYLLCCSLVRRYFRTASPIVRS